MLSARSVLEFTSAPASAHEEIKLNTSGSHHFLGYVIRFGKSLIYHSGDTVSLRRAPGTT
jgi:hypothetical protein